MPKEEKLQPPQHQRRQPGRGHKMEPRPRAEDKTHRGSGKLQDKVAMSKALADKCIRVNGVAPGPV